MSEQGLALLSSQLGKAQVQSDEIGCTTSQTVREYCREVHIANYEMFYGVPEGGEDVKDCIGLFRVEPCMRNVNSLNR